MNINKKGNKENILHLLFRLNRCLRNYKFLFVRSFFLLVFLLAFMNSEFVVQKAMATTFLDNNICSKKLQNYKKLQNIIKYRDFDNYLKNSKMTYTNQHIVKTDDGNLFVVGGEKIYEIIEKTRKGSLLLNVDLISFIDIKNKKMFPLKEIDCGSVISVHRINNNELIIVGSKFISCFNIKTCMYTNVVPISFPVSLYDKTYILPNKNIIYISTFENKVYLINIQNGDVDIINDSLVHENAIFLSCIKINDNEIFFYNGLNKKNLYKKNNEVDYNYIYFIKENKFVKEKLFGNINEIENISNDNYFALSYKKEKELEFGEDLYIYDNAQIINLQNRKIIDTIPINSLYFKTLRGSIPKFYIKKVGKNILFFENRRRLNKFYDIDLKSIKKSKNKKFKFAGYIQQIIPVSCDNHLIITSKGIYIYK